MKRIIFFLVIILSLVTTSFGAGAGYSFPVGGSSASSDWSGYPATGTVDMATFDITNAGNITASGLLTAGSAAFGGTCVVSNNGSIAWGAQCDALGVASAAGGFQANVPANIAFLWANQEWTNSVANSFAVHATGGIYLSGGEVDVASNLTVGADIILSMSQGIKWVTDPTNYIYFAGQSSTQMLMQFVVDGVTSNTYFNMVSE